MKKSKNFIPFFLWLIFLLVLSSIPGNKFPQDVPANADKVIHFIEYGLLSFFWLGGIWGYTEYKKSPATLLPFLFLSFIGIMDEIHQLPIPEREFSYYDILTDILSIVFVFVLDKLLDRDKLYFLWRRKDEI